MYSSVIRERALQQFEALSDPSFLYGSHLGFVMKEWTWPWSHEVKPALQVSFQGSGMDCMSCAEAYAHPLWKEEVARFDAQRMEAKDRLESWQCFSSKDGWFVHVSARDAEERTLIIERKPCEVSADRVLIVLDSGARLTVAEQTFTAQLEQGALEIFSSQEIEIRLGVGAKLTYVSLDGMMRSRPPQRFFSRFSTRLESQANFRCIDLVGAKRFEQRIGRHVLGGEGAQVDLRVLFLCDQTDKLDSQFLVFHEAPRTHSSVQIHGLVEGESRALSQCLTRMPKGVNGSHGFQAQRIFLLGEHAEMQAVPKLEINTDDVTCHHSVSIRSLDEETLFYLMSRGLDEKRARALCVEGHLASLIPSDFETEVFSSLRMQLLQSLQDAL